MGDPLVQLQGITKSYREGEGLLPVLRGIDLAVETGETISIVGASGAGKSTLLHIIGTLDPPSAGSVLFQGRDLLTSSEDEQAKFRNQKLGFVFQFHHLLNDFTALDNVCMPLLIHGEAKAKRQQKGRRILAEVGLAGKEGSLPTELSGGEQQRVAVARAMVTEPVLLLADEPTGNLDARTGRELMDLLFALNRSKGLTLIYVSHNEELAARAGRRLHLREGVLHEG